MVSRKRLFLNTVTLVSIDSICVNILQSEGTVVVAAAAAAAAVLLTNK